MIVRLPAGWTAYKKWVSRYGQELSLPGLELSHDQLFFLNYAQMDIYTKSEHVRFAQMDIYTKSEHVRFAQMDIYTKSEHVRFAQMDIYTKSEHVRFAQMDIYTKTEHVRCTETSEALHLTQQQQKIDPEQQLYTPKIENIAAVGGPESDFQVIWCGSMRPEDALNKIRTSVHSPGPIRVLGPLSNSHDFAKAYKCKLKTAFT
ncbi:MMEL1, partial [Cordylochernes scorpioides]